MWARTGRDVGPMKFEILDREIWDLRMGGVKTCDVVRPYVGLNLRRD